MPGSLPFVPEPDQRISPTLTWGEVDFAKFEDQLRIYDDRVRGWLLGPARALLDIPNSNFALLQLLLSYFEPFAMYASGKDSAGHSAKFFQRGFVTTFGDDIPLWKKVAEVLYREARCLEAAAREGPWSTWTPCCWIAWCSIA